MSRIYGSVLVVLLASGCDVSPAPPADAGHGHAHAHHEAGPHGGHLIGLGQEEFHAEWLHDDESGLITVFILDEHAESEVEAGQVAIDVKIGDSSNQHQLNTVDASAGGAAVRFELTDKSLIEALKMAGQGTDAKITVEIEGQAYTGNFEAHSH
jgi:hypothetical protein